MIALAETYGGLRGWAIEGAGGYGAGLTRVLIERKELVVELDRPSRPARRAGAKSDAIDAERAARDALSRTQLAAPKTGGQRAALQTLLTARRSAVDAATTAGRQLRALVFTVLTTLRALARRITASEGEAAEHEHAIKAIVRAWRSDLLNLSGVGAIVAAVVLTAWSHPGRCRSDAAFAMLGGVAPIPASSGKTVRHRLNRSGDRQLNRALHTIVLTRLRVDDQTRAYAEKCQPALDHGPAPCTRELN